MRPPTSGEWSRNVGDTVTETVIADEWGTQHLPLTSVALAAAVPIIEAEVRERIAREIEALAVYLVDDQSEPGEPSIIHHAVSLESVLDIARGSA